ncbi:hypothetical protein BDV18DRAFT_136572, partial [Aspergillus unguis]
MCKLDAEGVAYWMQSIYLVRSTVVLAYGVLRKGRFLYKPVRINIEQSQPSKLIVGKAFASWA